MIEIKKDKQLSEVGSGEFFLFDDGEVFRKVYVYLDDYDLKCFNISIFKHTDCMKLSNKKVQDFPLFTNITFYKWFELDIFTFTVRINCHQARKGKDYDSNEKATIRVAVEPKLKKWKFQYDYVDYEEIFLQLWESNSNFDGQIFSNIDAEEKDGAIAFEYNHIFCDNSIFDDVSPYTNKLREIHEETTNILEKQLHSNSISTIFTFPEEIKISCEQYLVYFAQFLQDLGIKATSKINEEAGKILFSITPTDDVEALDKIREALAIYLNLPASPIIYNESFAAMRLQQQVENLQHSQKMTAREIQITEKLLIAQSETIQEKNLIISQKDSVIEQQSKIIEKITNKSIMTDSLENKEELEKFCEGFEVGKSEFLIKHFGLHLNPVTVLKNAGRKILGKEERKSILDLGEEIEDKEN